jgi:DNA (cytosine-5)-methyltransferase 1
VRVPRFPAVSLFTNCGAGDLGYEAAGFRFQVLAELDEERLGVAALNLRDATVVAGDLRETWPSVVTNYRSRVGSTRPALLSACPPCQGMSSARSGRGLASDPDAGSRDQRNLLVEVVARVAEELQPRLIVVENVFAFLMRRVRHPETQEPISAARLLIERLANDYEAFAMRADLADYGVPQSRRRSFLALVCRKEAGLARLRELDLAPFPQPTHGGDELPTQVSLADALSELTTDSLAKKAKHLHVAPGLDKRREFMVASIPPNGGSSAWENDVCASCGTVEVEAEDALCPNCQGPLARPVARDGDYWRLIHGFRNSSYRRMRPDKPAATITTASGRISSDNTLHPSEHRVLTVLECQHLQTFPMDFDWGDQLERRGHASVRAMIGEAVPPLFTELHGRILTSLLNGHAPRKSMSTANSRIQTAERQLKLD